MNLSKREGMSRSGRRGRLILLFMIALFILTPIAGFIWATETPGTSYSGPIATPTDPELARRLERHVQKIATGPRNLQDLSSIDRTIAYLVSELEGSGYAVQRQEVLSPADNLIVRVRAAKKEAPVLVVGAHYDSFGAAPGADDNASGVASLLELARGVQSLDGTTAVNLVLVFFANEEPPYFKTNAMGSLVHARSIEDTKRIIGMISLESMGVFYDEPGSQQYPFPLSLRYPDTGNFIAFVGDLTARDFLHSAIAKFRAQARIPSVGGTAPSWVKGIDWSDHWSYSQQGIPAIMVTDTALFRNSHYHLRSDDPETLDYQRLALVVEGLRHTIDGLIL